VTCTGSPSDRRVENSRKINLIKGAIRQLFSNLLSPQEIKALLTIPQALVCLTELPAVTSSNGSNPATFATGRKSIRSIGCAAILVKISPRPHEVVQQPTTIFHRTATTNRNFTILRGGIFRDQIPKGSSFRPLRNLRLAWNLFLIVLTRGETKGRGPQPEPHPASRSAACHWQHQASVWTGAAKARPRTKSTPRAG